MMMPRDGGVPKDDYARGYSDGWAANNEYRADKHKLQRAQGAPSGSFFFACTFGVFGSLFMLAALISLYRFGASGWSPGTFYAALGVLTAVGYVVDSIPKDKAEAKRLEAQFKKKWKQK
jgi:hypothetical protein